jgi:hypothetical protein
VSEIANAIVDAEAVSILEPNHERDFPFFENPKRPQESDYIRRIRFSVYWRKASFTWPKQAPLWVFTTATDLKRMEDARR